MRNIDYYVGFVVELVCICCGKNKIVAAQLHSMVSCSLYVHLFFFIFIFCLYLFALFISWSLVGVVCLFPFSVFFIVFCGIYLVCFLLILISYHRKKKMPIKILCCNVLLLVDASCCKFIFLFSSFYCLAFLWYYYCFSTFLLLCCHIFVSRLLPLVLSMLCNWLWQEKIEEKGKWNRT